MIGNAEDLELVGKFTTEESAVKGIIAAQPHVVLIDTQLNLGCGLHCMQQIKSVCPEIQFIVTTVLEDAEKVFESLKCGATGYILKGSTMDDYLHAIRVVASGGSSLSPSIARKLVNHFGGGQTAMQHAYDLTERERAVLELLSKGYMYKQVAEQLHVSMDTVRTHIRHIYEKLQVHSRTEAINKVFPR